MNHSFQFRFMANTVVATLLSFVLAVPVTVRADFMLPDEIRDKVEVVSTFDSRQVSTVIDKAAYAEQQRVSTNLIGNALKPEGKGGVYEGKVVRVTQAFPLFRVYTQKKDPRTGLNNRFGGWWTHIPPAKGTSKGDYRRHYEICGSFNPDLDRVVKCRIYPGALLLIGPGQSVDEQTCGKPGESYAADTGMENLQIFLFAMFSHRFTISDEKTPLQDVDHYIGCPVESVDRTFEWYTGERGADN